MNDFKSEINIKDEPLDLIEGSVKEEPMNFTEYVKEEPLNNTEEQVIVDPLSFNDEDKNEDNESLEKTTSCFKSNKGPEKISSNTFMKLCSMTEEDSSNIGFHSEDDGNPGNSNGLGRDNPVTHNRQSQCCNSNNDEHKLCNNNNNQMRHFLDIPLQLEQPQHQRRRQQLFKWSYHWRLLSFIEMPYFDFKHILQWIHRVQATFRCHFIINNIEKACRMVSVVPTFITAPILQRPITQNTYEELIRRLIKEYGFLARERAFNLFKTQMAAGESPITYLHRIKQTVGENLFNLLEATHRELFKEAFLLALPDITLILDVIGENATLEKLAKLADKRMKKRYSRRHYQARDEDALVNDNNQLRHSLDIPLQHKPPQHHPFRQQSLKRTS